MAQRKHKFIVQTRDQDGEWSTCVPMEKNVFRHGTSYTVRYQYEDVAEAERFKQRVVDYCLNNRVGITAARVFNEGSEEIYGQVDVNVQSRVEQPST